MSTSPQALAAAYQACLAETLRQCPQLISRWCTSLVELLYDRSMAISDNSEKRLLQDSIASLKRNQSVIEQGFAAEVAAAIEQDTRPSNVKRADRATRSLSSLSFDDLELMGDNQVQETVDSARVFQVVAMSCEGALAAFSARLSTAQGYKVVKADKNPLRPEVMSQALIKLLQDLPADHIHRMRWLTLGSTLFGKELQELYVMLRDQLTEQGIPAAAYGMVSASARKAKLAGQSTFGDSHAEAQPLQPMRSSDEEEDEQPYAARGQADKGFDGVQPPQAAAQERSTPTPRKPDGDKPPGRSSADVLTLDHLHRLLVGDYDESFKGEDGLLPSNFAHEAQNDFSHTVPAAMDVLAELKEKGIATTRARKSRIAPPLPLAQMRAQLKTEAKSLGQSLAIEVVGLMIEQMANDPRLLAPVREMIAHAEPAYLRLGLSDPRFFSDKGHPGRRLLEVITARSMAYASEDAPGFVTFMDDVNSVAQLLTEELACDSQHFSTLLEGFERKLASRQVASNESQSKAVQALLQAEQRNLLAEKVAAEIRSRKDFVAGNRIITAFLTGPWAQVMAKERLLGEHGGEGSRKHEFSLRLGEILWSLDSAQTVLHRKRLVKIIPDMLQGIRAGLLSIEYPLSHSKAFFDELMEIHQAALKGDSSAEGEKARAKARNRQELEDAFDQRDGHSAKPWLAPTEAQNSGFMDDSMGADTSPAPAFESTRPQLVAHSEPVADRGSDSVELRLGDWVELLQGEEWVRAQLTWISPYNTLFMFTSTGGRTHSMTGPLLQYLLLQQHVRVVSQQGVLDGALDNVARTAMQNSVDGATGSSGAA